MKDEGLFGAGGKGALCGDVGGTGIAGCGGDGGADGNGAEGGGKGGGGGVGNNAGEQGSLVRPSVGGRCGMLEGVGIMLAAGPERGFSPGCCP